MADPAFQPSSSSPKRSSSRSVAVVGAGISGLATAYYLKQARPKWHVTVFERHTKVGGKVRSSLRNGFTFDWGPNGFLTNADDTLSLAISLDLGDELNPADDAAGLRYLYKNGALHALPAGPKQFLKTDLLSVGAKARAALEYLRGKPGSVEETVFEFIERHFGTEVAQTFAEAAVLGVTAGNARELSVDALFPRLRKMEADYGSLLRAMTRAERQSASRLTSFKEGGMQRLIDKLRDELEHDTALGIGVAGIMPLSSGFELSLSTGVTAYMDDVVLATPAFVSGELLSPFLPGAGELLKNIPYADVAVFGLGYNRVDVPLDLDGFGFLVPRDEGVRSLGVLWSSSIFPSQAPEGQILLRVICGGTLDPDFMSLSDAEALSTVRDDLERSMGITAEPIFFDGVKWPKGIPQYELGHAKRLHAIQTSLAKYPGLYLTGNAYHGVGVNDCVRDAKRVVAELADNADKAVNPDQTYTATYQQEGSTAFERVSVYRNHSEPN